MLSIWDAGFFPGMVQPSSQRPAAVTAGSCPQGSAGQWAPTAPAKEKTSLPHCCSPGGTRELVLGLIQRVLLLPLSCRLFKIQLCSSPASLQCLTEAEGAGWSCCIHSGQPEGWAGSPCLALSVSLPSHICLTPQSARIPPNGLRKMGVLG